jgi:hypothetical protein
VYQGQHPKKGMREQARSLLIYQALDVGSSQRWMPTRVCCVFLSSQRGVSTDWTKRSGLLSREGGQRSDRLANLWINVSGRLIV